MTILLVMVAALSLQRFTQLATSSARTGLQWDNQPLGGSSSLAGSGATLS